VSELAADEPDLRAEEERLRLGRLTLRDRLRAMHADDPGRALGMTLRSGDRLSLRLGALGRDWLAGETDAGALRSVIVPLAALASLDPVGVQVEASLRAEPAPEPPTALSARLGIAFVLRDLCRRRAAVELHVGAERWHGTIDRVGRDHFDLAEHAPGEPRRAAAVARIRIVAFAALDLVRF
jgi:hypothetical protein